MTRLLPFLIFSSLAVATPLSPEAASLGNSLVPQVQSGKLPGDGETTFDGVELALIQPKPAAAVVNAAAIDRKGWTVVADSFQAGNPPSNILDGNNATIWHSEYSPVSHALPHQFTVDMLQSYSIGSISYLPRQDSSDHGYVGEHIISVSTDNKTFTPVAYGTYIADKTLKKTTFTAVNARWVRLQALTDALNLGPWTSCSEFNVFTSSQSTPPAPASGGVWGPTIDFPLVPVSMANEPGTGNVLAWSSYNPSTYTGSNGGQTITATYSPNSHAVTSALVTQTHHDMFCEGLSLDFSGRSIATGGNTAPATSIYSSATNTWIKGPAMKIGRGYHAMVTTSAGNSFTIGASWAGGRGGKNGEIYNPTSNTWNLLPGTPVAPMLTHDYQGVYRADNHAWLFGWKDEYVFQAGPSVAMNWYGTKGNGSQTSAGTRTGDNDAMCGNAVMFDAVKGLILTVGGAKDYQKTDSTSNAHIITLGTPPAVPKVQQINDMAYNRTFATGVVLPDGTVLIMGGQVYALPFSDGTSQYTPELFNPVTNTFKQLAPAAIPRNYHSTAVLMADGTVINGGGGLCGKCLTNHYDAQIFTPPYLFTATGAPAVRPVISSINSTTVRLGGTLSATTNGPVTSWALLRQSSTTHTVNTDQRRIPLTAILNGTNTYTFTVPSDPGVGIPGFYFLFALDAAGVPSISKTVQITPS